MEAFLFSISVIGIGWLVAPNTRIFLSFWIGTATIIALLPLWHLFSPVNSSFYGVIFVMGAVGWLRRLRSREPIHFERQSLLFMAITLPLVALYLLNPTYNYDDGLYHLQIMRWYSEYPVVPGLANLHGRFGFNSSFFLLTTLLQHWTTPLLVIAFAGFLGETPRQRLMMWFIPPILLVGWAGYSNDFALILFGAVAVSQIWIALDRHELNLGTVFLLVSVPMIKVSAAPLILGCLLLLVYPFSRQKLWLLLFGGFICIPYLAHSVVLSGYPLFPLKGFGLAVDWRVPDSLIENEAAAIYSWARLPGAPLSETLNTWGWVGKWWQNQLQEPILFIALCVIVLLLPILVITRERLSRQAILVLPTVGALVYWFVTAPDARFGALPLWMLVATLVTLGTKKRRKLSLGLYSFALLLSLLFLVSRFSLGIPLPVIALNTFVTEEGLEVHTPISGTDQCWIAPLPCSPTRLTTLKLRGTTLASGFTLDHFQLEYLPSENNSS